MSQSPLLTLALAGVSCFVTLGCLRPHPGRTRSTAGEASSTAVEEPRASRSSADSYNRGSGNEGGGKGSSKGTPREAPPPPPKYIPTTVEVRSDCSKTTPVFYGDGKPGFSSGRRSSISSHSISSEGRKGDGTLTIWVIDDHENGLSNVKITPDTKSVTLNSDCKSFKTE